MVANRKGAAGRSGWWHWLSVASVLAWPLPSFAQVVPATPPPVTTNEPRTTPLVSEARLAGAREAFSLGATLARQGQWVDALVAFERSYRLHPHSTTLFNIGFCERALGRFTRARKSFRGALTAGTPEAPGLGEELTREAQGYLEEIERRIVRATVVIRQASLRITVNGRPLEAETSQPGRTFFVAGTRDAGPPEVPPVAVFELLLDPGEQSIVISTDGLDRVVTRRFDAGSTPRIELSAPQAARVAKDPAPRQIVLPAIAYGIGAAGVVVGTVFGVATFENAQTLSEKCPQRKACPPDAQDDLDASRRDALISNVGFGVAVAGGLVGTWLLLTSQPSRTTSGPVVLARVGVASARIEGSF